MYRSRCTCTNKYICKRVSAHGYVREVAYVHRSIYVSIPVSTVYLYFYLSSCLSIHLSACPSIVLSTYIIYKLHIRYI